MAIEVADAVICLARLAARNAIKQQLKAQGIKPWLVSGGVINAQANEYLLAHHRELFAQAALSPIVQNLGITISRRRVDPQQKSLCRNQVRNGEPK
jgi:hypothetical protein